MAVATQDMKASTAKAVTKRPGTTAATISSAKARVASAASASTPSTSRPTSSATHAAASKGVAGSVRSGPSKAAASTAPIAATVRASGVGTGARAAAGGTKAPAAATATIVGTVQRSSSLKVGPTSKTAASANPARSSTPAPAKSSTLTPVRSSTPTQARSSTPTPARSSTPLSTAAKKPIPAPSTTSGAKAVAGTRAGADTATGTPPRRVPATASARTTTSIRIAPGTNGSAATKPPSVGGRPPVNMTPTTVRTSTAPSTSTTTMGGVKSAAGSPMATKKSTTGAASPTSSVSRTNSTKTTTPASSRPGTKTTTSGSTPPSPLNARRVSSSSTVSLASSTSGSGRVASSPSNAAMGGASTPFTPTDLKRAIANIRSKLEETTSRLKAKEDELVLARRQLEDETAWLTSTAVETASSDGGETMIPDIDFSKISNQDKETVVAALSAKEKDIARIKNHIRTLKARIQRLRLEHERKFRELDQEHSRKTSEKDSELTRLHQELAGLIQQFNEKQTFRQKFDDARVLHARSLQELRRIHEDKLESLGQELQAVKSQVRSPVTNRKSTNSTNSSSKGKKQDAEAVKKCERDLEARKKELAQEKKALQLEHEKEISRVRADLDKELQQAVAEHEAEVKERLGYELTQIKASHSALIEDRHGKDSTQDMTLALQERHQRSLQDQRARLELENKQYLCTVQTKQQNEISSMTAKHQGLIQSLEAKVQKAQEQYESNKVRIATSGEQGASQAKKDHFAEKALRRAKQMEELSAIETVTRDSMQKELDGVQAQFATFVGENQARQDKKIKEMETGYEERIAELIVEHENRVRELENLANEQVQDALDRVEGEFERNQQVLLKSQEEEKETLKAEHEMILGALEDKLTEAEHALKATMDDTRKSRKLVEAQKEELKKDTEQQLLSLRTSVTTLSIEHETREITESVEQEKSRIAAVERQKLEYQKIHADTLVKAEKDERARREKLAQEIQALKNAVKATHSERDKARAVIKAKEARWLEGHTAAIKGINDNHESSLKEAQQSAQRRLSEMTRLRNQAAEKYADKMSNVTGAHQLELQSVHTQLSTKLKSKEQSDQQEIQALESRLVAAQASLSTRFNGSNGSKEQIEKLIADLLVLQKQTETLKSESQHITMALNKLQDSTAAPAQNTAIKK